MYPDLTQRIIISYQNGAFPMGEEKTGSTIEWVVPQKRGLIPIGAVHCSKSLRKEIKKAKISVSFDTKFAEVVNNCASREVTWINKTIFDQYQILHSRGLAHSVEIEQNGVLVGGLYGLALGAVFFAESMFSKISNGSKLALIAMMARVNYGGYQIFDTQFPSPHLKSLGGITVKRKEFEEMLKLSIKKQANFNQTPELTTWDEFLKFACKGKLVNNVIQ